MVDLIIVSDATTEDGLKLTNDCISTSRLDNTSLNIIVIERNNNIIYDDVKTIHYDFEFNYNACLNLGIKNSNSEFIAVANNDLIFHENWAKNIISFFKDDDLLMSACSLCGLLHGSDKISNSILYGTEMISETSFPQLCGWFIFQRRKIYDTIGYWDEDFKFWYCDDDYREKLKKYNIKHGLVFSSRVDHLGSRTLNKIKDKDKKYYNELTSESEIIFNKKHKL